MIQPFIQSIDSVRQRCNSVGMSSQLELSYASALGHARGRKHVANLNQCTATFAFKFATEHCFQRPAQGITSCPAACEIPSYKTRLQSKGTKSFRPPCHGRYATCYFGSTSFAPFQTWTLHTLHVDMGLKYKLQKKSNGKVWKPSRAFGVHFHGVLSAQQLHAYFTPSASMSMHLELGNSAPSPAPASQ